MKQVVTGLQPSLDTRVHAETFDEYQNEVAAPQGSDVPLENLYSQGIPAPYRGSQGSISTTLSQSRHLESAEAEMTDRVWRAEETDNNGTVLARIDHLKKRGKGSYFCSKGLSCQKGGVTAESQLREYHRNSEFR